MAKRTRKSGLAPGSVIFTGKQKVENVQVHFLQYTPENFEEQTFHTQDAFTIHEANDGMIDWYDIRGLHDTDLIQVMGNHFQIHNLILEDVADIYQRPKFEEYEDGIFLTLRAIAFDPGTTKIHTEHVAVYFRKGIVLTFQETESDLFHSVRQRLRSEKARIRTRGADYLVYALLDTVVDQYIVALDLIEEELEKIEDTILLDADFQIRERIHLIKKEVLRARKIIAPFREAVMRFSRSEHEAIAPSTGLFLRDLYDHAIQTQDTLEGYRDVLNGLEALHLSEISFKMNQVMQMLTIITMIFVPLSFLAGLYGMNFVNIPELNNPNGYYILLSVMVLVAAGMLWYFKRKKWL